MTEMAKAFNYCAPLSTRNGQFMHKSCGCQLVPRYYAAAAILYYGAMANTDWSTPHTLLSLSLSLSSLAVARLTEGSEHILFREKFTDWPEPGRIIKFKDPEKKMKVCFGLAEVAA